MASSFTTVDTAMMQSFQVREQIDADILVPPPPPDFEPVTDGPTTYEKVNSSSQQGKDKLIDNNGYTFTYRKTYASGNILRRYSVRNKYTTFSASVTQAGDTFTKGGQPFCHQSTPGAATAAKVTREVKDAAMSNFFTSSASSVDRVILSQEDNRSLLI